MDESQCAPDVSQVFELGGDVVSPALAHGLMRLVAEGAGEGDEAADAELRAQAAAAYLRLLEKPKLPNILLKVRSPAAAALTLAASVGCSRHCQIKCVSDSMPKRPSTASHEKVDWHKVCLPFTTRGIGNHVAVS